MWITLWITYPHIHWLWITYPQDCGYVDNIVDNFFFVKREINHLTNKVCGSIIDVLEDTDESFID